MTSRTRKLNKTELIPKVGSVERYVLVAFLTELEKYKAALGKKGRLLTAEELVAVEEKYPEGMTWDEIEEELHAHGIEMTKAAFRRHIHEKLLPESAKSSGGSAKISRQTEDGKTFAVFPQDMLREINFNRFFLKFADRNFIEEPMGSLGEKPLVSYSAAIESCLGENTFFGLRGALEDEVFHGWGNVAKAIERALASRADEKKIVAEKVKKLNKKVEIIRSEIDELVEYLEGEKIHVHEFLKIIVGGDS